jgi:hypothetical protein
METFHFLIVPDDSKAHGIRSLGLDSFPDFSQVPDLFPFHRKEDVADPKHLLCGFSRNKPGDPQPGKADEKEGSPSKNEGQSQVESGSGEAHKEADPGRPSVIGFLRSVLADFRALPCQADVASQGEKAETISGFSALFGPNGWAKPDGELQNAHPKELGCQKMPKLMHSHQKEDRGHKYKKGRHNRYASRRHTSFSPASTEYSPLARIPTTHTTPRPIEKEGPAFPFPSRNPLPGQEFPYLFSPFRTERDEDVVLFCWTDVERGTKFL